MMMGWFPRGVGLILLLSTGCVTGDDLAVQAVLNQAAFVEGSTSYRFGHESILEIPVVGGPDDVDLNRWAMLHDGTDYRLYFFREGSAETIYQYAYNPGSEQYEFGFRSLETLTIADAPKDAELSAFSMLHDGQDYRLYLRSGSDPNLLHQFGFNAVSREYEYGFNSLPTISVNGFPADADPARGAMLHSGDAYRLYRLGADNRTLHQSRYNIDTQVYEYGGVDSIPSFQLEGIPASSGTKSLAMLHDGSNFRLYFLEDR